MVNKCSFPQRVNAWYLVYISSLFILFMQFYLVNYTGKGVAVKSTTKKLN